MPLKPTLSKRATTAMTIGLLCCLTACTGTLPTPEATPAPETVAELTLEDILTQANKAQQLPSPEKDQALLAATRQLIEKGETFWAGKISERINDQQLSDQDYIEFSLLSSELYIVEEDFFQAQSIVTKPRLETLWQQQLISIEQQQVLRLRRAELASKLGDAQTSIQERIVLATLLLPGDASAANQQAIWQDLMSLPKDDLALLSQQTQAPVLQGWYQLAFTSKSHQGDLEAQNRAIQDWVSTNPGHPASQELPQDLLLLQDLIQTRPQQIALLLPLQGKLAKAGRAIREGFFAAYFEAYQTQQDTADIRVYDTSQGDINTLYDQAVNEGASLVIGPLEKEKVADLELRLELPIPVLALNYIEKAPLIPSSSNTEEEILTDLPIETPLDTRAAINDLDSSADNRQGFYQFGLSLEDEARQVAERAWLEGHRIALVISPTANWGARSAKAFIDAWGNLGGKVVRRSEFGKGAEYSKVIKQALNIDRSQQRSRTLKRLFGQTFEFEPRRRQDIDMIFLVARPREGRQIKPTLAFHYAGNVPVYSTSQIFASMRKDNKDSDLNGIRFTTLPWVFDGKIPAKKAIQDNLRVAGTYERLYAMGVDAFLLYPRLRQLQQLPEMKLYGATGELKMVEGNRIVRQQQWAEIRSGEAKPLPSIVTSYQAEDR